MDKDHEKDTKLYDPMEILRDKTMESEKYKDNRYKILTSKLIYVPEFFICPHSLITEDDNRTYRALNYIFFTIVLHTMKLRLSIYVYIINPLRMFTNRSMINSL